MSKKDEFVPVTEKAEEGFNEEMLATNELEDLEGGKIRINANFAKGCSCTPTVNPS